MGLGVSGREGDLEDRERRVALAAFLRARRARLSPQQVGLPEGGRRRTPGLRREEVALLAGVGVAWYTWLEQGRPIAVSDQVVESLVRTLRLDDSERLHLYALARQQVPLGPPQLPRAAGAATHALLRTLNPYAAYAVSACGKLLAWNTAACQLFVDFELVPEAQRNIMRFVFTHPAARERFVDWGVVARQQLAVFRSNSRRYLGAPVFNQLITDLQRENEYFRLWWAAQEVHDAAGGEQRLHHPENGLVTFQLAQLTVAEQPEVRLVVYIPVGDLDISPTNISDAL